MEIASLINPVNSESQSIGTKPNPNPAKRPSEDAQNEYSIPPDREGHREKVHDYRDCDPKKLNQPANRKFKRTRYPSARRHRKNLLSDALPASGASLQVIEPDTNQPTDIDSLDRYVPTLRIPVLIALARPHFFCTFCKELGNKTTTKTKQDWKRHEQEFHKCGLTWRCNECHKVFQDALGLKSHCPSHQKNYGELKIIDQHTRIYACGFKTCSQLFYTFDDRCRHVGHHMEEGLTEWTFDQTIHNLLQHDSFSTAWKLVCDKLGLQYRLTPFQLQWNVDPAHRARLEYFSFPKPGDLKNFLVDLYKAGVPTGPIERSEVSQVPLAVVQ